MVINIWQIEGYRGFDDWDNSEDNNVFKELAFDAAFDKKAVEKIFFSLNDKYRNTVLTSCNIIRTIQI